MVTSPLSQKGGQDVELTGKEKNLLVFLVLLPLPPYTLDTLNLI